MPIYEYRCESCDHEFEKLVRPKQSEPEACPDCDEPTLERLVSNTNFQLKGSGWYETDYADDDEPEETPPPEAEAAGGDADGEGGDGDGADGDDGDDD